MTRSSSDESEPIDPSLERIVERAMRACSWLLPTTVEDVRRAEAALNADPIPLPERLRDPFRLLDRRAAPGMKGASPCPPQAKVDQWQTLPNALRLLALQVDLTFEQALKLLGMGRQVVAHRSSTKKDEMDLEDWRRFYEAVREFL